MLRKPKMVGLALVVAFAMSGLTIASASAAEFHSSLSHTILTGGEIGTDTLSLTAGTIHCSTVSWEGTMSAQTTTAIDLTPEHSGCSTTPFGGATIHTNNCFFSFTAGGEIHIVCPAGKNIQITSPFCTITIYAQTFNSALYSNSGSGIHIHITGTGVAYTQTAGCTHGAQSLQNGVMTGTLNVTGESTAGEASKISFS